MVTIGERSQLKKKFQSIRYSLALATVIAGAIPLGLLLFLLVAIEVSLYLVAICALVLGAAILFIVLNVNRKADYQFQTIHTLLDSISSGDYSIRGLSSDEDSRFYSLVDSINDLASSLQDQRLRSHESTNLLRKVVDHIDVAIIAFDYSNIVQMVNPEAVRLLNIREELSTIEVSDQMRFTGNMKAGETHVVNTEIGGKYGRYRFHKEIFISDGETQNLIFITDVSNILRLEERKAWKNLMRVLSHEINNSVAPLSSYSNSLIRQVEHRVAESDLKAELVDGLTVIRNRAKSMGEFVARYKDVFVTPEPVLQLVDICEVVNSVTRLFSESKIVVDGESVSVLLDPSLMGQALINFVKNGLEASSESLGDITDSVGSDLPAPLVVSWEVLSGRLVIVMTDTGPGISNPDNLFIPFYTTKPGGSGVGLMISKQIIESHNGTLTLQNRLDSHGCILTISLPCQYEDSYAQTTS